MTVRVCVAPCNLLQINMLCNIEMGTPEHCNPAGSPQTQRAPRSPPATDIAGPVLHCTCTDVNCDDRQLPCSLARLQRRTLSQPHGPNPVAIAGDSAQWHSCPLHRRGQARARPQSGPTDRPISWPTGMPWMPSSSRFVGRSWSWRAALQTESPLAASRRCPFSLTAVLRSDPHQTRLRAYVESPGYLRFADRANAIRLVGSRSRARQSYPMRPLERWPGSEELTQPRVDAVHSADTADLGIGVRLYR